VKNLARLLLLAVCLLAFPTPSPAPLVYRPGEGWSYEPVGAEGQWQRARAKEQLDVAQAAFDAQDYGLAEKAAHRVLVLWPMSDAAPQAQYLEARCYEASGSAEKAFQLYQTLLEKQPRFTHFEEIRHRQFELANLYLGGKWFIKWGFIPYKSMNRVAEMYASIVKTGPYADVAPQAQLKIGEAREKEKTFGLRTPDYSAAVRAYELAADRYYDQPKIASEAMYRAAWAYDKQAQSGDRDQTAAGQAITKFTDFMALYPNDTRVAEAQKTIGVLRTEQARGNFMVAEYYQKHKKWEGARIYYNEAQLQDPNSPLGIEARKRLDQLKVRPPAGAK
jgi:outer membrane protein assembly factor BamD